MSFKTKSTAHFEILLSHKSGDGNGNKSIKKNLFRHYSSMYMSFLFSVVRCCYCFCCCWLPFDSLFSIFVDKWACLCNPIQAQSFKLSDWLVLHADRSGVAAGREMRACSQVFSRYKYVPCIVPLVRATLYFTYF